MTKLANFPASCSPAVAKLVAAGALPAFPSVNQLDGSSNADDNCFIVAPADCINWLTGSAYTGAEVLVDIYGDGYSGGGDSWAAPALAWYEAHGCHLDAAQWADDNNVGDVLSYVRNQIDAGHPCVTTWPSLWGIQTRDTAGGFHAVVCYGYEPDGSFDFANPWGGILQNYPGDWVASRVVNAGAMWRLQAVNYTGLGAGFEAYATQHGLTAPLVTPGEVRTSDPRFPGESFAVFAPEPSRPAGTFLYYTDAGGVVDNRGPWLVWELFSDWQAAKATIAKLQSAPPPAPAPAPVDTVAEAAKSALKTLAAALAASAAA